MAVSAESDIFRLLYIFIGFILIVIGITMPKLKTNRWIGIRIKWTMEDPAIWNLVHRIAGPLWIIGGCVVTLSAVFLHRRWLPNYIAIFLCSLLCSRMYFSLR